MLLHVQGQYLSVRLGWLEYDRHHKSFPERGDCSGVLGYFINKYAFKLPLSIIGEI